MTELIRHLLDTDELVDTYREEAILFANVPTRETMKDLNRIHNLLSIRLNGSRVMKLLVELRTHGESGTPTLIEQAKRLKDSDYKSLDFLLAQIHYGISDAIKKSK